ncbi:hypothetical protein Cgig2_030806 [Carnegiea gigantea]|uniref:Uncharacterized protein n=1 Tax=Carnegiea gigantea TaxID=171969 RepID=A0A9Q1QQT6_9CARY|nr:hypothetical protein Cgig2_030806 [Carnegiea gigantea]
MVPHRLDHVIGSSKPSIVKDTTFHILEAKRESNDMNPKGRNLGRKGGNERTKAREGAKSDIQNCNPKGKGKSNHVLLCKQRRVTNASRNRKSKASTKDKDSWAMAKQMTFLSNVNIARQHTSNKNKGMGESHDIEAANEVWTLMNKDYPGNGKAHHNPPINNR